MSRKIRTVKVVDDPYGEVSYYDEWSDLRTVDGKPVPTKGRTFEYVNILSAEVGKDGPDPDRFEDYEEYKTFIGLEFESGYTMEIRVLEGDEGEETGVEIGLTGIQERNAMIDALEYILMELRKAPAKGKAKESEKE